MIKKIITLSTIFIFSLPVLADECNDMFYKHDFDKTILACSKMAEEGNENAQQIMGIMYLSGDALGENKDGKKALYWYEKSAENGSKASQYVVATLYFNGDVVPRDIQKSIFWYKKSAENGHTVAAFNLGMIYQKSLGGVSQDNNMAKYYYQLACKNGSSLGCDFYKKMD